MKKACLYNIIIAVFILTSCQNNIKEADLTSVVLNSYKMKFADATNAEWQKVNELYEVEFEIKGIEHAAQIDEIGNLKKVKYEIEKSDLPSAISTVITQQYKNYKVDEVEKVEQDNETFFQIELDGKKDKHLVYSSTGKKQSTVPYWD